MEQRKTRFDIRQQLGEGSFSKIFNAYDKLTNLNVALKIEKEDKSKKVLKFEYQVLKNLQDVPSVPRVYDFVENPYLNYIVMQLLGKSVMEYKKSKGINFTPVIAYDFLIQMINAIEKVHEKGYIHRDIKPSNFVLCPEEKTVYIVDFGLSKLHLNKHKVPYSQRKDADFRGTVAYASINAHDKIDLSRRDDMFSFFFVIMDLLNEKMPWRSITDDKLKIEKIKRQVMKDPERHILLDHPNKVEFFEILNHVRSLKFADKPNYQLIRGILQKLLDAEIRSRRLEQEKNLRNFFQMYSLQNLLSVQSQNLNLPFSNQLISEVDFLYPLYMMQFQSQLNSLTNNFFTKINHFNTLPSTSLGCQNNKHLSKKRARSSEDEDVRPDRTARSTTNNSGDANSVQDQLVPMMKAESPFMRDNNSLMNLLLYQSSNFYFGQEWLRPDHSISGLANALNGCI